MSSIAETVTVETLPIVAYQGARVVTTEVLAGLYGTGETNIQDNHRKNADRFEPGKHFFKLDGEALRDFKNRPENFRSVGANARSLILWTERGAARHAKMLDTDQAWEVFERLEDAYFRAVPADRPAPTLPPTTPTPAGAFLAAWHALWPARRVVLQQVVRVALADLNSPLGRALVDLLSEDLARGEAPDLAPEAVARRLGYLARALDGVAVDGYRLEGIGPKSRLGRRWCVACLADAPAALPSAVAPPPRPALPAPEFPKTVRQAINRKAHALGAVAFEHNVEVLEDWLRRQPDLSDPDAAIARLHALELDHGQHVMVNVQALWEITSMVGAIATLVGNWRTRVEALEVETGRRWYVRPGAAGATH